MFTSQSFSARHISSLLAPAILAVGLTPAAWAQNTTFVEPVPQNTPGAESPGFGQEALHKVRYTVKADGTVSNVQIVGGFTNDMAPRFLTPMIESWTFEPGTVNGEPADFHNQEFIIEARLTEQLAVSDDLQGDITAITDLIAKESYSRAVTIANNRLRKGVVTVLDYTVLHALKGSALMSMDKPFAAIEALKTATMSRVGSDGKTEFFMERANLESALRRLYLLEVSQNLYTEAVRTYDIIDDNFDIPADDQITTMTNSIREAIETRDALVMNAGITGEQWTYEPMHRIVAVSDVDGRITKVNVRCDRRELLELEFQEGVDWTIPESFGKCALDFVGSDDTTFTLYEFAQ